MNVHQMYEAVGGYLLSRSQLIDALKHHFNDDLVLLQGKGFAKMLMFREKAMTVLQMVKDDEMMMMI